jgi:YfiH family protein
MMLLLPDWPNLPAQFGAGMTLRTGGVSLAPYDGFNLGAHVGDQIEHVMQNRTMLAKALPNEPEWLTQVHSATVLNLDEKQHNLVADACITTQANVVCAVLTADCLPVLFCDAKNGVVGAAHAGWRGLAEGVLENTIAAMQSAGANPAQIVVWLGPAIGPSKFEIGAEVRARFVEEDASAAVAFMPSTSIAGKFYADIYQLARMRLQNVGVHHISGGEFCTFSEPEKFYSYRRDGVTGRMASLIWIK